MVKGGIGYASQALELLDCGQGQGLVERDKEKEIIKGRMSITQVRVES